EVLTRLLKVTHGRVGILQTIVVVGALGQYGLAEVGLKGKSGFSCLARLFTEGDRWSKIPRSVSARINIRQQRPSKGELRVQPYRFSEIFLRVKVVGDRVGRFQTISQAAQIGIVSLWIVRRFGH